MRGNRPETRILANAATNTRDAETRSVIWRGRYSIPYHDFMAEMTNVHGSSRGAGRPVRRRTRTFRPNYLSFAGTYQCNLSCPHCCVPIEWTDRLDIKTACRFLDDAHRYGIEILGFTGGEPFPSS
jgi:hypothetical protein